jgi:hypothetical protein
MPRWLSPPDLKVEITIAVLCEAATVRDGVLQILGAGLNRIPMPTYPAPLPTTLALRFELDLDEGATQHSLLVQIVSASDDAVIGSVAGTIGPIAQEAVTEPELPVQAVTAVQLSKIEIQAEGRYDTVISVDNKELRRVRFAVRPTALPGTPPSARIVALPPQKTPASSDKSPN